MGTRAHEWPVAENSFRSSEPARADQFWGPAYRWKRAMPRWPVAENCIVALLDQTIRGTDAWPYTLTDLEGQLIVQPCRTFLSTCQGVFRKWNNPMDKSNLYQWSSLTHCNQWSSPFLLTDGQHGTRQLRVSLTASFMIDRKPSLIAKSPWRDGMTLA